MKRIMSCRAALPWLMCLLGALMLCSPWQVQAVGTVPVSTQYTCGSAKLPTAIQAETCFYQIWLNAYQKTSCGFNQWTWVEYPAALNGYVPFSPICGYGHVLPVVLPKISCPDHSTGSAVCTCDNGYKPDPTNTSCISECFVADLSPLTDPVAIDFENGTRWRPDLLTADYQIKLACVKKGISNGGGTSAGTSAYRPTQYQQHLFEIVQKDTQLKPKFMTEHPECQVLRAKVTLKMADHSLRHGQLVATPGTSRHESGMAFDLTPSVLTDVQLTTVYKDCGVTRNAIPSEPWHVQ